MEYVVGMIVGIVGYIDYGKISLVCVLIGIEIDCLQEECMCGIFIELGYVYVQVENIGGGNVELMLGFVDVLGYECFVYMMVVGVIGIDVVLLVIVVDDGVMLQIFEYLVILQLLGVDRGVVVLIKIDCVEVVCIVWVEIEIVVLLVGMLLQDFFVFVCNSMVFDDVGINVLCIQLYVWVLDDVSMCQVELCSELFCMLVDCVFLLVGYGMLVIGVVYGGIVVVGEYLQLMLIVMDVCVCSIYVQNQFSEFVMVGQCCVLNLVVIVCDDIYRGDWIVDLCVLWVICCVDVCLWFFLLVVLLCDWVLLYIYWGMMYWQVYVVLLEDDDYGDGQLVQLVFDVLVCVMCGDCFIVCDLVVICMLGGGIVFDLDLLQWCWCSLVWFVWLGVLEQLVVGVGIGLLLQQVFFGIVMVVL